MQEYDEAEEELEAAPDSSPLPPPVAAAPVVEDKDTGKDIDLLDMDQVLEYTQKKRVRVVNEINKKLHQIEDPAMINAMLKGLGDMDKAVVQRRRVGIDEELAKTAEAQARDTAGLLNAISSRAFMRVDPTEAGIPPRERPKLPDDIGGPELVPGEIEVGTQNLTYDDFAKERNLGNKK